MNEDWLVSVQDAIHETDPRMVEVKIRIAEAAIFNRIHDFSAGSDSLEEQAMFDALGSIRILRSSRRLTRWVLRCKNPPGYTGFNLQLSMCLHAHRNSPNCGGQSRSLLALGCGESAKTL